MRSLVGSGLALALVISPVSASAQAGEEGGTPKPNLEKPVSGPEPDSEVPDIETLSQGAIQHYQVEYASPSEEKKRHERRRQRGLAIGLPIAVVTVIAVVLGSVAVSRSFDKDAEP
jgi:hypothetical protein